MKCGGPTNHDFRTATYHCVCCGYVVTQETLDDYAYGMAIVRSTFQQLFSPGLRAAFGADDHETVDIMKADAMALLHPDTSQIPIWRKRPTRVEHPMVGWRAWDLDWEPNGKDAYLLSVAAECVWEGPVLRAHMRPVDPKYWDALKRAGKEYIQTLEETFHIAGVWAVKTKEAAMRVAAAYHGFAHGRIKMWGRVAQFKDGYRAEVCMIDELWIDYKTMFRALNSGNSAKDIPLIQERLKKIAQALENRYQCKVNVE